jgi:hypothetical protein
MKINGKPINASALRKIGYAIVNIATAVERAALQAQQAVATGTPKDIAEAQAARKRVGAAIAVYRGLIA